MMRILSGARGLTGSRVFERLEIGSRVTLEKSSIDFLFSKELVGHFTAKGESDKRSPAKGVRIGDHEGNSLHFLQNVQFDTLPTRESRLRMQTVCQFAFVGDAALTARPNAELSGNKNHQGRVQPTFALSTLVPRDAACQNFSRKPQYPHFAG
jgi:hypothetical protein